MVAGQRAVLPCVLLNYSGIVQWTKDGLALGMGQGLKGEWGHPASPASRLSHLWTHHPSVPQNRFLDSESLLRAPGSSPARLARLSSPPPELCPHCLPNPAILFLPGAWLKEGSEEPGRSKETKRSLCKRGSDRQTDRHQERGFRQKEVEQEVLGERPLQSRRETGTADARLALLQPLSCPPPRRCLLGGQKLILISA